MEQHLSVHLEERHVIPYGPASNILHLRQDPAPVHLHRPQDGHLVAQQEVSKSPRCVKPRKEDR